MIIRSSPENFDEFDGVPNSMRAQAVAAYLDDCYRFERRSAAWRSGRATAPRDRGGGPTCSEFVCLRSRRLLTRARTHGVPRGRTCSER